VSTGRLGASWREDEGVSEGKWVWGIDSCSRVGVVGVDRKHAPSETGWCSDGGAANKQVRTFPSPMSSARIQPLPSRPSASPMQQSNMNCRPARWCGRRHRARHLCTVTSWGSAGSSSAPFAPPSPPHSAPPPMPTAPSGVGGDRYRINGAGGSSATSSVLGRCAPQPSSVSDRYVS
jgi:hypothetical protein